MRAAVFNGPGSVEVAERPDPVIQEPTDAVVRVVLACVCGSDLWYCRGESPHAGRLDRPRVHRRRRRRRRGGRRGSRPAIWWSRRSSSATCPARTAGTARRSAACGRELRQRRDRRRPGRGGTRPARRRHAGAGPRLRPFRRDAAARCSTLSDVMSTGHHAAVSAGVKQGDTVAVVGDGAVGLCAVLAAKRLGAERIIALSRHPRPPEAGPRVRRHRHRRGARRRRRTDAVLELTGGVGVDAALECVGTAQSIATAFADRPARVDGRHRRGPARRGAVHRARSSATSAGAAARPRRGSTSPTCSPTCSTAPSTPAWSSTTRPTSTTSPTPTGRWTSGARSSR